MNADPAAGTFASGPARGVPAEWTKGKRRSLLQTRIFDVVSAAYVHPDRDGEREFLVIDAPDWGIVLPVTDAGRLLVVRQFRFGIGALSWELPGGVIERGEDPIRAVQRELKEETGYEGRTARLLGVVHPNPAIFSNRCHIVLVEGAHRMGKTAWDADEEIEFAEREIDAVLAEARSGGITHALMLNALFLLEPWWRERAGG
jgi:8-oxo-dGTP pyrophosphatase MutT (NUDIX family)